MSAPIHQRLADEFRARIATGQWPEGLRAPSESALCDEFGVSRGPVRQALATLRVEGLLVGGQGRPPLVRTGVPLHAASALGSLTAWAADAGRTAGQRTILQSRHDADAELARRLGVAAGDPVLTIVRARYLDDEPAVLERMSFIWEVGRTLMEFDPDSGSINRFMLDRGIDLYSSNHEVDAVAAAADDVQYLGMAAGAPMLRVRRTTEDSTGRVIEFAEDRYVPGQCAISITNRLTAAGGRSHIRLA